MRVVAYNIKSFEKEPLAVANRKKHEITLISNPLNVDTALFAAGKVAVVVTKEDDLSDQVIRKLSELGVKYIATRSVSTEHINIDTAGEMNIKIAAVPPDLLQTKTMDEIAATLAEQTIINLDAWQGKSCLGNACVCSRSCDRDPVDFLNPAIAKHEH
ncbi:lactate dehydrogenase [Pedobacter sp. SAFR-022]|uniref:lactate dehydrogenase n=1 Tax=Pedobacter sp. SAFR-022 TaxID=3436861 RepID=UPI003F818FBA